MSTTQQVPASDRNKLHAFIGQFVTRLGASVYADLVVIGEKLGLCKALAANPMAPAELAVKTNKEQTRPSPTMLRMYKAFPCWW